jgi:hypothetical protein
LPFFAQVLGDDRVRIDDTSQSVVDQEIGYARLGRLDYWAFLLYEAAPAKGILIYAWTSLMKAAGWFLLEKKVTSDCGPSGKRLSTFLLRCSKYG